MPNLKTSMLAHIYRLLIKSSRWCQPIRHLLLNKTKTQEVFRNFQFPNNQFKATSLIRRESIRLTFKPMMNWKRDSWVNTKNWPQVKKVSTNRSERNTKIWNREQSLVRKQPVIRFLILLFHLKQMVLL